MSDDRNDYQSLYEDEPEAAVSEGRNDYQSLYNEKPYAAVSEGTKKKHKWVGKQMGGNPANAESYEWIRYCDNCGLEDSGEEEEIPECPSEAAQPQPAGTETISKEIRSVSEFTGLTEDQTLRFVGCLLRVGLEIFPSAQLAALQRSHDACVVALTRAERKLRAYVGVCKGDKELTDTILPMAQAALANAEKLRAAK